MRRNGLRIARGAGFAPDWLDPAVELVSCSSPDRLALERISEHTTVFALWDDTRDPAQGRDPQRERRMRALLPAYRRRGPRRISDRGVANGAQAAGRTAAVARALGLFGLSEASVLGHHVSQWLASDTPFLEGVTVASVGRPVVGANAFLGADAILPAIATGAEVVRTGRFADPSLILAPLRHALGWTAVDLDRMAVGRLVGHLLECGMQLTDDVAPGVKDVSDLARGGSPSHRVLADGQAVIGKTLGPGDRLDRRTVLEPLVFEVDDPDNGVGPDVSVEVLRVIVGEIGADCGGLSGAREGRLHETSRRRWVLTLAGRAKPGSPLRVRMRSPARGSPAVGWKSV